MTSTDATKTCEPCTPARSGRLSFLERFLTLWIFLAMAGVGDDLTGHSSKRPADLDIAFKYERCRE